MDSQVSKVAITPDSRVAFLYNNHSEWVVVYDIFFQKLLAPIQVPNNKKINQIIITPNSRLALLFHDYEMVIYDVSLQSLLPPIQAVTGRKFSLIKITPCGRLIFLSYSTGDQVDVYEVSSQKLLTPVQISSGERISGITISPDSRLAFFYADPEIVVYEISSKKSLIPIQLRGGNARCEITFTIDNQLAFLYKKSNQIVTVYDLFSKKILAPIKLPGSEEFYEINFTFTLDNRLAFLYKDSGSSQVVVYDIPSRKQLASIQAPEHKKIYWIKVSSDNNLAFLGETYRILLAYSCRANQPFLNVNLQRLLIDKIFNLIDFSQALPEQDAGTISVRGVQTSSQSIILYGKGGCYIWFAHSDRVIPVLKDVSVVSIECFPGNNKQMSIHNQEWPLRLLTTGEDGTLRLWDISDLEKPLLKFSTRGMSFYADGAKYNPQTKLSDNNKWILQRYNAKRFEEAVSQIALYESKEQSPKVETKKSVKEDDIFAISGSALSSSSSFFSEAQDVTVEAKDSVALTSRASLPAPKILTSPVSESLGSLMQTVNKSINDGVATKPKEQNEPKSIATSGVKPPSYERPRIRRDPTIFPSEIENPLVSTSVPSITSSQDTSSSSVTIQTTMSTGTVTGENLSEELEATSSTVNPEISSTSSGYSS